MIISKYNINQRGYIGLISLIITAAIVGLTVVYFFENDKGSAAEGGENNKNSIQKAESVKKLIEDRDIDMSQY